MGPLTATTGNQANDNPAPRDRALEVLRSQFQLPDWKPGQREVVEALLEGRNSAAIFPTGGGKSLCYQLPALLFDGLTVVVSPLMALMKDQVESLNRRGIFAVRLDSSLTPEEARQVPQDLRSGKAKILFVAPERFFNERFRQMLSDFSISLFAIDEAHCISQWGHQFRPDYLKLSTISKQLRVDRVLALTATATPSVIADIRREFSIAEQDVVQTPFYRPNLSLRFALSTEKSRMMDLVKRLRTRPIGPTLVYVSLQRTAEEVAEELVAQGFEARAYHAGMEDEDRKSVQDWFMTSQSGIVAATIAFGMGVDKQNIRYVYHLNPAKSLESYAQEVGRAGRDGGDAICETLLVPEDRIVLENFVHGDVPTQGSVRQLIELIAHQHDTFHVSYYSLSAQCDIRDLVVRTLMTYLELDGYLESKGPRYDEYKFKPRVTSAAILSHFEGERRQFAASVLAMAVKKKIWCEIDITKAVQRLGCERERIVRMLEYFSEQGWMELQVSGLVHGYQRVKGMSEWEGIADELFDRLLKREQSEIARIDQLYGLATSKDCQSKELSTYFGQSIAESCSTCSQCRGEAIDRIPSSEIQKLGDSAMSLILKLSRQHQDALADPRQQARFLVGLTSPLLTRKRLSKDPGFGSCSQIPFGIVLAALESR